VTDQTVWFVALPFLVALCMVGGFVLVWSRGRWDDDRPWWTNPLLWLAVGVVFVVLGVFVWPGLFAGTLIVLPFVWFWRPRRPPPVDPRTNGHAKTGR
jgi:amino acid transporter